jgi:8-oxo-dGTP diphosphatase
VDKPKVVDGPGELDLNDTAAKDTAQVGQAVTPQAPNQARAYNPRDYPPFAVAVDIAVFTLRASALNVLLVERGDPAEQGKLALPGGFIRPEEDADQAANRELLEETGIGRAIPVHLEQLRTYSDPGRDPRMRVVSVAYVALAPDLPDPVAATDARAASWYPVDEARAQDLAFDHNRILDDATERVRAKLEYTTIATAFLPRVFSIGQLRAVYQAVWGTEVEPQNFRRKVLATPGFIEPTADLRLGLPGPRAQLYRPGPATEVVPPSEGSTSHEHRVGNSSAGRSARSEELDRPWPTGHAASAEAAEACLPSGPLPSSACHRRIHPRPGAIRPA